MVCHHQSFYILFFYFVYHLPVQIHFNSNLVYMLLA